jgi:transcriptional regulator with XRE-family HTH domain
MSAQELLNKRLQETRLSQRQVSTLTGIPQPTLSKISRGQTTMPDYNTARKLARFLKVPTRSLYDD